MPDDLVRDKLIARAISAIGIPPFLQNRVTGNLSRLSNEEIAEHIERADELRQRVRTLLDSRS